jgi:hypothetical protein
MIVELGLDLESLESYNTRHDAEYYKQLDET